MTDTDLGTALDELVVEMVKKAKSNDDIEVQAKVLKIASQHYATMQKVRGAKKPDDDDERSPNMSDLRNHLKDENQGPPKPAAGDESDE